MENYQFKNNFFEIHQYDQQKTSSSFLPGLAGKRGIPLWAFYVNRGQAISSFGLRDKNGAILEFYPANLAYMYVNTIGFRTFIKKNGVVKEYFDPTNTTNHRVMKIAQSKLILEETDEIDQIKVKVTYFGLPQEDVAALTRRVEITYFGLTPCEVEILDGINQILPSGIDYGGYKAISNLLRSWMNVENLDDSIAFYKLRSSTGDEAETKDVKDGNYYVSFVNHQLTRPIADLDLVFGLDTTLRLPRHFDDSSLTSIQSEQQVTENKVPCGYTPVVKKLLPNETVQIDTLIGYTKDIHTLLAKMDAFSEAGYFSRKEEEASQVIDELLKDVETHTNVPLFDEYIRQNYLDNLLRGGYPMTIEKDAQSFVYYLYSRKHGDLERDYNFFSIAPEFYSQGNGNFRDVCQNRRSDVLFHPKIKDYNIHLFASLIQADGYNPLGINGSSFHLKQDVGAESLAMSLFDSVHPEIVEHLKKSFTPGSVINLAYSLHVGQKMDDLELLQNLLGNSVQEIEASFNEGYWVDHWTYILDLIDNYQHIYPDKMTQLLFDDFKYDTFLSPISVYPRSEKTVIDKQGVVRQYGALRHPDKDLMKAYGIGEHGTHWLTLKNKEKYTTNLYSKLFLLAFNKFALLDPMQIGIEMEGNKPGWNDAMNGLPGLFGSGVSETLELKRLVSFLRKFISEKRLSFPNEFLSFVNAWKQIQETDSFQYWDQVATLRETYREALRTPLEMTNDIQGFELESILESMDILLDKSIEKALDLGKGIIPTYLTYEAVEFTKVEENNAPVLSHYGLPKAVVKRFKVNALPYFLEAPARYLKVVKNKEKAKEMILKVKASDMYDNVLGMYKTSSDLESYGYEIGRIRAFTKGWLERESNFLHMTYKYLLGILKSKNTELFFEEAKTNLVYLLDPKTYGRSTLENSSFIATSNNPNPSLYGQGFVSRLSGSTAEMLSIFANLIYGDDMYHLNSDRKLALKLETKLPVDYFKNRKIEVRLHGVNVEYLTKKNAKGPFFKTVAYELEDPTGYVKVLDTSVIPEEYALLVRMGQIKTIRVFME